MGTLIGQSLGRYHIIEQLGEGGMATVYKAYDTRLERDVAVKIIRVDQFAPAVLEHILKRFEREAKALGRLTQANIVGVIDYGEYEDSPYLVMEYLPGGTLKQRMSKPIPWQEAVKLLLPVAEALEYAHSQGIVHRDVKPSNILLNQSGQPMLTDFGIAKLLESEDRQTLTGSGVGVGTPEYMAPEQVDARTVDGRADIYSLGIVLFELITGRKPYTADTPMAVMIMQARDPLPRPSLFTLDLPEGVEKVLLKALAKKPEDRYQSMAGLVKAMEGLILGKGWEERAESKKQDHIYEHHPALDIIPAKIRQGIPGEDAILKGGRGRGTIRESWYAESEKQTSINKMSEIPPQPATKKVWLLWVLGLGVLSVVVVCVGGALIWGDDVVAALFSNPTSMSSQESVSLTPSETEPIETTHPIAADRRVRQALVYCTNKLELIKSVYPLTPLDQQQALVLNSFIPSTHWAYAGDENINIYDFNPAAGAALLDESGWRLAGGDTVRTNAMGETLTLKFTTTTSSFRQTWGGVWVQQMAACGIEIIEDYVEASWWFGDTTGLTRRDFELGAFAWVLTIDPGGRTLYACDQIPSPSNDWAGQNYMGWCNETASDALIAATKTIILQERKDNYRILQQEFTRDVPSIPLFNRVYSFAHTAALTGFEPVPGQENYLDDVGRWKIPGQDTIILGFTQEPASLHGLVDNAWVTHLALSVLLPASYTTKDYNFQAVYIKDFPTIENGGSVMNEVAVTAGDKVADADSNLVTLETGTLVKNFAGEVVSWTAGVTMQQIVSTFEYIDGITWQNGTPLSSADFALYRKISCDPASGSTSFFTCDLTEDVIFLSDKIGYVQTWVPGYTSPLYFVPVWDTYPAHRVTTDGRRLVDVPAAEWSTLYEVKDNPWGWGPYQLVEWIKGDKLVFKSNPYWVFGTPKTPNFVIQIVTPEAAEALLLGGEIDMLDSDSLASLTQALFDAETAGQIKTWSVAGGTWEHIDIRLDE